MSRILLLALLLAVAVPARAGLFGKSPAQAATEAQREQLPAVTIWVDALGGAKLRGRVQRIAPAAGSEFAVLKPDNATGNFVKVPQRIGVYIRVNPGQKLAARLRPGMSVETRVETGR